MKKVLHVIKPDHNCSTKMCDKQLALLRKSSSGNIDVPEKELNFFIHERKWHKGIKW